MESSTTLTTSKKIKKGRVFSTLRNPSLWAQLFRLPLQRLSTSDLSSKTTTSLKSLFYHCSLISWAFLKARRRHLSNCPWQQTAWKIKLWLICSQASVIVSVYASLRIARTNSGYWLPESFIKSWWTKGLTHCFTFNLRTCKPTARRSTCWWAPLRPTPACRPSDWMKSNYTN